MRKRTEAEKIAMGMVEPILRELSIRRDTRGYVPLLNMICYAYANPKKNFNEIMDYLEKEDFYVGVVPAMKEEKDVFSLRPSMVRTIETALETSTRKNKEILMSYGLEKLSIIAEDWKSSEKAWVEEQVLLEIGEKYAKYDTHEKRVIVFF